jgi:hypothetical protein
VASAEGRIPPPHPHREDESHDHEYFTSGSGFHEVEDEVHGLSNQDRELHIERTAQSETKDHHKDAGTQRERDVQPPFPVLRPTRRLVRHAGKLAFVSCHRASNMQ